jgi:hypothetical protein
MVLRKRSSTSSMPCLRTLNEDKLDRETLLAMVHPAPF